MGGYAMKRLRRILAAVVVTLVLGSGVANAQQLLSFTFLTSAIADGTTYSTFPTSNILLASQANRAIRLTFLNVWLQSNTSVSSSPLGLYSFRLRQVGGPGGAFSMLLTSWIELVSLGTLNTTRSEYTLPLVANPGSSLPLHYLQTEGVNGAIAIEFGGSSALWRAIAQGYYLAP